MAVLTLLIAAVLSFVGVLLGIMAVPTRNSAYALLFFYLIPAATVLAFAGAILMTRGHPSGGARNRARIVLALVLSFALGAGMSLMTRL